MAWSDEPTDAQLGALCRLLKWRVSNDLLSEALEYLRYCKTRREVSYELRRVRDLYIKRKLDKNNIFDSEIWDDFALVHEEQKNE